VKVSVLWFHTFLLLSLITAAEVAVAQTSKPAPESWKVADPQLTIDAKNAYKSIRLGLVNLDYRALVRTLADNALPLVPKDRQTKETVERMATELEAESENLRRTRQLQIDVDALSLSMGTAMMLEINKQNSRVLLVRMPLKGTRELAVRHRILSNSWTIDENGDLSVLMVKHEGNWYWNPFGW
jgi:hypothetical protein